MSTSFKFEDPDKGIDIEKIHSDLSMLNAEIAPELQASLEAKKIDAKSAAIFFTVLSRRLVDEIDEKDFSELCFKLFTDNWGDFVRYDELSRHEKQLLSSQYPYKRISELFDTKEKHVIPGFRAIEDIEDFKEEAEKEGVSLMQNSDFLVTKDGPVSLIDIALGDLSEDSYRAALELAKVTFDPIEVLRDLAAIEATRLREGIAYEKELGLGLNQDTQASMNSLVNITKIINNIEEGQKYQIEFSNNLAGMISGMDLEEEDDNEEVIDVNVVDGDFKE